MWPQTIKYFPRTQIYVERWNISTSTDTHTHTFLWEKNCEIESTQVAEQVAIPLCGTIEYV